MDIESQKKYDKIKDSAWSFFIERRAISWILMVAIVIMGVSSFLTLPREIQPEINIPIGAVSTVLPGASPTDTESLLTEPLEKEIGTISDIKTLTSTSGFGSSLILIEFEAESDLDKRIQDLKDAVERVKPELPDDALEPFVIRAEANEFAIITYSLMGDRPLPELTKVAEDLADALEKVSGVAKADVVGKQVEQVHVLVDPEKLENYGLDLQTVANIIKFSNANLPLGVVSLDKVNYSLRLDNRFQTLDEIRNLPIINFDNDSNTNILLKDIAKVETAYAEQNVVTKLSIKGEKSFSAVSIQVYKKDQGNILEIVDTTKEVVQKLKDNKVIPDDLDVGISNDNSLFIRSDLGALTDDGAETAIFIFVILLLALGMREGFIAGFSVPLTFLLTFAVMDAFGLTLNSLSLFSLLIGLGITVDTAIVMMQGIHENLQKGLTPKDASLVAISTYRWPLIVGSLTNMFAFFPMLLVSGLVGEFLKTMPIVISAALIGSLVINLTIIPAFSSKFLRSVKVDAKVTFLESIFNWMGAKVTNLVRRLLHSRSYRVMLILSIIVLFVASMFLPISGVLKAELFPQTDQQYFIVRVEGPTGMVIGETEKIVEKVEKALYKIPEIENFLTIVGSNQSPALSEGVVVGGAAEDGNLANITVNLLPKEERERKSYVIGAELEKQMASFTEAKITVDQLQEGPPTEDAITVRLVGEDLDTLKALAAQVKGIVEDVPGTKGVETSLKGGLNEFQYVLDKDALSFHGLSAGQVAIAVRNMLQGVEAVDIKLENEDKTVIVKYDLLKENGRTKLDFNTIESFEIQTPKGYAVSFSQLADYSFSESPNFISREDQKKIVKVTSDIDEAGSAVEITKLIQAEVDKIEVPPDHEIKFGGDFEDVQESFADLYRSMTVGILLILFCLVLQFNSFKQPLIILITVPLALIGVFPGLLLLGLNLSFPAFLGVVALGGIVVNNAIVLIDRINENRSNHVPFEEAITDATSSRFQAIFMTTLSNIIGILPLALSNEFWAGLGFSIVFGLVFSTVLTLVVIPTFYYIFEVKAARKNHEM